MKDKKVGELTKIDYEQDYSLKSKKNDTELKP